jgi:isoleucyl-tRNA synthetase
MFNPVSPIADFPAIEEAVLKFWKERNIYEKSSRQRAGGKPFVYYGYPPVANIKPEISQVAAWAYKDIFLRYKAMRGHWVLRHWGWNTHGLPVEVEVEKRLGLVNKQQVEEYGIGRFNEKCRRSVFDYLQDWQKLIERFGFWVDLKDAYVTHTHEYIESVWWLLKEFWEKGLLTQSIKVGPYCPRCGTPLSEYEATLGCREAEVNAVYIRLPLVDDPVTSLLVWTSAPWELSGNVAVAIHPEQEYVTVERKLPEGEKERLILARSRLEAVFGQDEGIEVVTAYKGKKLKGKRYRALYTFLIPNKPAHRVVLSDEIPKDEGTGLLQIAPLFAALDMQIAHENNLPVLATVQPDGTFIPEARPFRSSLVWEAEAAMVEELDRRGLLLRTEKTRRLMSFCWYCNTPLLQYAYNTWYLKLSEHMQQITAYNRKINWYPTKYQDKPFGDWLGESGDWVVGRERYWGSPLPIWIDEDGNSLCVGSLAELAKLAGRQLGELDLHLPVIDELTFPHPQSGKTMRRVPELVDAWFEAGAMLTAQWHYPFDNQTLFAQQFPADLVCETIGPELGWFYALQAISVTRFEKETCKNVLCLGPFLDVNGNKMVRESDNLLDPWEVINHHGTDNLRWCFYTAGPPWEERHLSVDLVGRVADDFSHILWKAYTFFINFAYPGSWTPPETVLSPSAAILPRLGDNLLDRWLRSVLHALVRQVTEAYEHYDVPGATQPIQAFVDTLSRWYLNRNHDRFWNPISESDKQSASTTLYETLVILSKLLAPAMPFLAEELYQNLVCCVDPNAPESVHMAAWPIYNEALIDEELNRDMGVVIRMANLGQAVRDRTIVKTTQPLVEAIFTVNIAEERGVIERYAPLLAEALNVKRVSVLNATDENVDIPIKAQSGLMMVSEDSGESVMVMFTHTA